MKVIEAINIQSEQCLLTKIKMYDHLKESPIEPSFIDPKINACDPYIRPGADIELLATAYKKKIEKRFDGEELKSCTAGVFNSIKNKLIKLYNNGKGVNAPEFKKFMVDIGHSYELVKDLRAALPDLREYFDNVKLID